MLSLSQYVTDKSVWLANNCLMCWAYMWIYVCTWVSACLLPRKYSPAAAGEGIWVLFSEDVANSAAGDDLQTPTTLPHTEWDL